MEENKTLEVKRDGARCYDIRLCPDFEGLAAELQKLQGESRKICIVTDDQVEPLYLEEVRQILSGVCARVSCFVFQAGEARKNLATVQKLYEHLIRNHFDRKDLLAALGGGVAGDLTGFAAATYLRGVDFIQLPTTLLAQVDSSIGGKTGVDFEAYKNMVGAFHMPRLVYMNLGTLKSLPDRQFAAGMAEIIKHGLIQDPEYYRWLRENSSLVMERQYPALLYMIEGSCRIKRRVVEEDPTEQGIRAWLNFGHTIGHAVEKLKGFTLYHGECVALGSVAAAYLSWKRGLLCKEELLEIEDTFLRFGLPVRARGLSAEQVRDAVKLDKKMEAGRIKFVLLSRLGEAFVARDVEDEEIIEAVHYISKEEGHE